MGQYISWYLIDMIVYVTTWADSIIQKTTKVFWWTSMYVAQLSIFLADMSPCLLLVSLRIDIDYSPELIRS